MKEITFPPPKTAQATHTRAKQFYGFFSSLERPKRLSLKERLNFGLMYQHPIIYNFSIWLNDPKRILPKAIAEQIEGQSVLDLGCGTGLLRKFLPPSIEYVGIDLNETFLHYAARKFPGFYYKRNILGDLSQFKADTVVLSDVLHHVTPYHPHLLENALNCARKKVLIAACYEKGHGAFKTFLEFLSRRLLDKDGFNEQRVKARWLNFGDLINFLSSNGATNFQRKASHVLCEIKLG